MDEKEICGGYDAVFDPPLTADFTCCICFLAFKQPMQLPCGHQFCNSCLERYRETHGVELYCPVDREEVDINKIFPDKAMQRIVLSFKVKCDNVKNCCDWSGELRDLEMHLENCAFASVKCTNEECTLSFLKMYLDDHSTNKCNFRPMICGFCSEKYAFKDEEEHTTCCRLLPIECINVCGELNIPRQEMDTHLNLCRLSILPCDYVALGCGFMGTMNQREEHDKADMQSHLKIAVGKISIIEKEMKLTKEKNINLEKRLEMHEEATTKSVQTLDDKFEKEMQLTKEKNVNLEKRLKMHDEATTKRIQPLEVKKENKLCGITYDFRSPRGLSLTK